MKEFPRKETVPFKELLVKSEFKPRLKNFENNPDFVIRKTRMKDTASVAPKIENIEELAHAGKKLFDELQKVYKIEAPVRFVVGTDEKETVVYSIADKIQGKTIENYEFNEENKENFTKELGILYFSWIKYLADKYKNNEPFLWDITENRQYIYGKKKGDQNERLYLVDVDIEYINNRTFLFDSLNSASDSIIDTEQRLGIKFENVWQEIDKFLDLISEEERKIYRDFIERLHQKINS